MHRCLTFDLFKCVAQEKVKLFLKANTLDLGQGAFTKKQIIRTVC